MSKQKQKKSESVNENVNLNTEISKNEVNELKQGKKEKKKYN